MDFTTNKSALLSALGTLSKITPTRTTLPVLSSVLIEAKEEGKVTLRSTDLELEMIFIIEANILEEGQVCAPIYKLLEITQNILEEEVSIHVNETNRMRIKNNTGKYVLSCTGTEEFPEKREDNALTDLPTEFLNETINNVTYSCSKDELKPQLNGVLLNFATSSVTAVATDGHRLVKFIYQQNNPTQTTVIVPQKFLNIIAGGTINTKKAELKVSENYITIKTTNQTLSTRLISDKFPDYENVIPKENTNNSFVVKQTIQGAVKRVSLMSNKTTKQVILNITANKIIVSAEDNETGGSATEEIETEHTGKDITIGFNSTLLLEILKHQKTEEIEILTSEPLSAALIKQKEEKDTETTTLLMPIRI